jgi:hypothetical protein
MSNTFEKVLNAIPVDDLCKILPTTKIFLLRILSKEFKDVVDNMHLCINAKMNLFEPFAYLNLSESRDGQPLKTTKNKLIIQNSIKSLQNINCFHKIVKLSLTGCDYFMDLMLPLIHEITTLEHLHLSSNHFGCNDCSASAQELINVLKSINLKTLVLIGHRNVNTLFKRSKPSWYQTHTF